MQVHRLQTNCNNNFNPAFKSVVIEKSAAKVLEGMSETERNEFNDIIKRISNTKFWDMRLAKAIGNANEFRCDFVNKKNPNKVYKYGFYPLEAKKSKVEILPVFDQDDSVIEKIKFSSAQRAQALIDMQKRHSREMTERNYKSTNLQRLTRWVEELEFLDEAYRYMKLGETYPLDGSQNTMIRKPTIISKILDCFGLG